MASLTRLPLFGYGFRPFFLACGVFACLVMPAWLVLFGIGLAPLPGLPAGLWHGHEMIFGFVLAAVAGFLLSAVPSSTRRRGFAGWPLVVLVTAWLCGRLAFAFASVMPAWALAVLELALLPILVALLAPPLVRERNRNMAMLAVLATLWIADAVFLAAAARGDAALAGRALLAALNIVLLLLTIVGGRIVPAFTTYALRRAQAAFTVRSYPLVERLLPPGMLLAIVVDAWLPRSAIAAGLAFGLAILHAWRLSGWRSLRVRGDAILWVLHVGYAWLPVGLLLKAVALLTAAGWARYWLHAFAVGALATMILAVTSRTALGHTGRPLVVSPAIAGAYGLLTLAACVRVAGPALWPQHYPVVVFAAGACWSAAFGIFVAVYGPILSSPRVDGRSG